jgi:hypothetical protein
MEDLGDDFTRSEMADESHLPGGAEHAAHRAARLGAHTNRVAAFVTHEHGFDGLAVAHAQEKLAGQAVAAVDFIDDHWSFEKEALSLAHGCIHPAPQGRQKGGLGKVHDPVAMKRPPEHLRMMQDHTIPRQHFHQFRKPEIVQGSCGKVIHARMQARGGGQVK